MYCIYKTLCGRCNMSWWKSCRTFSKKTFSLPKTAGAKIHSYIKVTGSHGVYTCIRPGQMWMVIRSQWTSASGYSENGLELLFWFRNTSLSLVLRVQLPKASHMPSVVFSPVNCTPSVDVKYRLCVLYVCFCAVFKITYKLEGVVKSQSEMFVWLFFFLEKPIYKSEFTIWSSGPCAS